MAIKFVDRVPTRPGRIKITPEDGSAVWYGVMERADEPSVEGTPINAANLNALQQNQGLSENVSIYVATNGSDTLGDGTSSAPFATITRALVTIPKQLDGHTATINIGAGTYNETVVINGFGGGGITLTGVSGSNVSITGLRITETNYVYVSNIKLQLIGTSNTEDMYIGTSNFYCPTEISMPNSKARGIFATIGSMVYINQVSVSQKAETAIRSETGSNIIMQVISGSGNALGLRAVSGGMIQFGTNNMTATSNYLTAVGGRIYSGAQTSIPNY